MIRFIRKTKSMVMGNTRDDTPANSTGNLSGNNTHNPPNNNPVANNTPNCPNGLPTNILAFRTITTMLSKIQPEKPLIYSNNKSLDSDDEHILRISNAFANLANIHHNIVALATKVCEDELQVIASVNYDDNNQLIHHSPPSKVTNLWNMVFCSNPRKDDIFSDNPHPTIVDTAIPSGVDPDDNAMLIHYIEKECYNKMPTLHEHLWILSKLLVMKDITHAKLIQHLLLYVVTVCYPKMITRIEQKDLSAPYLHSLQEVNMAEIEFRESEPKIKQGDEEFFLGSLVALGELIRTKIPNILKQARLMAEAERAGFGEPAFLDEQHKPVQLYTKDTYREFHALFLDLLKHFKESLQNLNVYGGDKVTADPKEFEKHLSIVVLVGIALQNLTRGAVLETHLKTIESSLGEHRRVLTLELVPEDEDPDVDMEPDKDVELDVDLEAVQPSASIRTDKGNLQVSLHVSYNEWLKLMLLYFDAVKILGQYVASPQFPFGTIKIKILVSPPVSNALLPWRELFKNSSIFSTKNVPADELRFTGDVILKELEGSLNSKLDQLARGALTAWESRNLSSLKNHLKHLEENSTLPDWQEHARSLRSEVGKLATLENTFWISDRIKLLLASTSCTFIKFMRSADNKGLYFSGSLHCEASLASFLQHSKGNDIYKDIRAQLEGFGQVIGVSKRCCPTCQYLLSLLPIDPQQPYLVIGSHSTVTACTLPPWLPADVVDSMNEFFGQQLRRELIGLINHPITRSRAASTGSRRISSDSGREVDGLLDHTFQMDLGRKAVVN